MIERKYISLVTFLLLSVFPVSFSYFCELCGPDEYLWDSKSISLPEEFGFVQEPNCGYLEYNFIFFLQPESDDCNSYKRQYQETCCNPNPCKLCGPDEALQWYRYVTSALRCDTLSYNMWEYTTESDECIMDKSLYQEICCVGITPSPTWNPTWSLTPTWSPTPRPTPSPTPWPTPSPTPRPTPFPTPTWENPWRTPSPTPSPVPPTYTRHQRRAQRLYIVFGVIGSIVWIVSLLKKNLQQRFETVQTQQGRPTGHQQATSSASPEATVNTARTARQELFLEKFLFQKVLSDKSNIYAASIRSLDTERGNNAHTLSKKEEEEEEEGNNDVDVDDHPVGDDPKLTSDEGKISSWRRMLSSWRKPAKDDECCICLENYEPGQLICAAVTDKCNHAFHKGCMKNWFESNDTCPICRTNFVES